MSTPISACLVYKAARGDEQAEKRLTEAMAYNLRCGHFTTFPCECKPPCPVPTQEQLEALNERVTIAIAVKEKKAMQLATPTQCCGTRVLVLCGKVYKCPCGKTKYGNRNPSNVDVRPVRADGKDDQRDLGAAGVDGAGV